MDLPKRYDGTKIGEAEDNNKRHRRCYFCLRLGEADAYTAGPLRIVEGTTVRLWRCAGGCKKVDTQYLDAAKEPARARLVPPYLNDADVPLVPGTFEVWDAKTTTGALRKKRLKAVARRKKK